MYKKHLPILMSALLLASTFSSLQAQIEWQINGNNPSSGQPILGTLYNSQNPQPLRFYANGNQRGIFSQYSGFFGIGTNEPKNPLHIHSNKMRNDYLNFRYLNPDPPIIANEEEEENRLLDSVPVRNTYLATPDY